MANLKVLSWQRHTSGWVLQSLACMGLNQHWPRYLTILRCQDFSPYHWTYLTENAKYNIQLNTLNRNKTTKENAWVTWNKRRNEEETTNVAYKVKSTDRCGIHTKCLCAHFRFSLFYYLSFEQWVCRNINRDVITFWMLCNPPTDLSRSNKDSKDGPRSRLKNQVRQHWFQIHQYRKTN